MMDKLKPEEEEKCLLMRNYWLGLYPESAAEAMAIDWLRNEEDSELLDAIKAELIEDFLKESLGEHELASFTKNFMPGHIEEIALFRLSLLS